MVHPTVRPAGRFRTPLVRSDGQAVGPSGRPRMRRAPQRRHRPRRRAPAERGGGPAAGPALPRL